MRYTKESKGKPISIFKRMKRYFKHAKLSETRTNKHLFFIYMSPRGKHIVLSLLLLFVSPSVFNSQ